MASTVPQTTFDQNNNKLLKIAWQRQQTYDKNAARYQSRFVTLRAWLAILSIAVVVLSITEALYSENLNLWGRELLNNSLLLLPIAMTGLLAFSVRFDRGQNWILLRGNAESLKMEIYYYRTRVGDYTENRDIVLAKRLKEISERMRGGPVHQGALFPYEEEPDSDLMLGVLIQLLLQIQRVILRCSKQLWNFLFQLQQRSTDPIAAENKFTDLTIPEDYICYRLENQFNWYRKKAKKLAKQLQFFQSAIYLFGGIGTLLGALEPLRSWVAMTTAITGAATNYLEFKRLEASLVGYNQAADALYDIRAWWYSLTPGERDRPKNFQKLVSSCEETIRSEHSSWLQDMQDRLANLYGTSEEESGEATQNHEPE